MKKLKLATTALAVYALSACEKISECETWTVYETCSETGSCYYVDCVRYQLGNHEVQICGESLSDAREGNTITIYNTCTTRQRTFIRRIF